MLKRSPRGIKLNSREFWRDGVPLPQASPSHSKERETKEVRWKGDE